MTLTLTPIARSEAAFAGRRGIQVFMPFGAPYYVDLEDPSSAYDTDPYRSPSHWPEHVDATVIAQIVAAGFDHVRLTLAPGPIMEALGTSGTPDEARIETLLSQYDQAVDDLTAAGLGVIVDPQQSDGPNAVYNLVNILSGPTGAQFLNWQEVVRRLSVRYADRPAHLVSIELCNEPPDPALITGVWSELQTILYETARAAAPNLTIIVTADGYSAADNVALLDPASWNSDPNVLVAYHPYRPFQFAIQGFTGNTDLKYHGGLLAWPPDPTKKAEVIATMTARVNADAGLSSEQKTAIIARNATDVLPGFFDTPLDRAWLLTEIQKVSTWADANDIPRDRIHANEYGVTVTSTGYNGEIASYIGAKHDDRVRWHRDMGLLLDAEGFRRGAFSVDAPDYRLTDSTDLTVGAFDRELLVAMRPSGGIVRAAGSAVLP